MNVECFNINISNSAYKVLKLAKVHLRRERERESKTKLLRICNLHRKITVLYIFLIGKNKFIRQCLF